MALDVIGAGFGRTGTRTLKLALEQLGFGPCYHMSECSLNYSTHVPFWTAAYRGERVDWNSFFSSYRATTDWPACDFALLLAEHFPEAKVVLTVRDPEKWYESVASTIYPGSTQQREDRSPQWTEMVTKCIWGGTFGGRFEEKDAALEVYQRHVDEVRRNVPAERLLVYEVREGWEPLCRFLGMPVPETGFPHEHERQAFLSGLRRRGVRV